MILLTVKCIRRLPDVSQRRHCAACDRLLPVRRRRYFVYGAGARARSCRWPPRGLQGVLLQEHTGQPLERLHARRLHRREKEFGEPSTLAFGRAPSSMAREQVWRSLGGLGPAKFG